MSSSKRWADVSSSDEEDERPVLVPVVETEEPILAKQDPPVKRERASFSHPRMPRQNEPAAPIFQRQTSDSYPARPARSTVPIEVAVATTKLLTGGKRLVKRQKSSPRMKDSRICNLLQQVTYGWPSGDKCKKWLKSNIAK